MPESLLSKIDVGNVQRWKRYGKIKRIRDSNLLPNDWKRNTNNEIKLRKKRNK